MKRILVVGCLLSAVSLFGCGERTESSKYYYSPSWTKAGNIIFTAGLQSVKKDAIGTQLSSTYLESISTMDATGAGERAFFDVTGAPPYALSCSSAAGSDYAAYLDELRGGLFGKVVIRNIAAGAHTGLERGEISFSPGIKSFDWSNDSLKIVYCNTREVRTANLDGTADTLVTAESNLEFVSWKYGTKIAFVRKSGSNKLLSLIYANGSGRVDLSAAASVDLPQISAANTNEVYGVAGGSYCKVDASAGTPATSEVMANFKGELPRLSAAADKVVYSKTGEQSGVYVLTLSTSSETKVK